MEINESLRLRICLSVQRAVCVCVHACVRECVCGDSGPPASLGCAGPATPGPAAFHSFRQRMRSRRKRTRAGDRAPGIVHGDCPWGGGHIARYGFVS